MFKIKNKTHYYIIQRKTDLTQSFKLLFNLAKQCTSIVSKR